MPSPRPLDPRAQAAIDHLRANGSTYYGAICPQNLPAALPTNGDRHSWRDAVTVFLLSELIGVHRVKRGEAPYWRGALYQVNRRELAKQFGCEPDDVSAALGWLKTLGLIFLVHRTRIDDAGKPCGTEVFVVPRMDQVKLMLDSFTENGYAMTASQLMDADPLQGGLNSPSGGAEVSLNDGSTPLEDGTYPNCAPTQQKLGAESGGESSSQRQSRTVDDDRRRQAVGGGGGEADDDKRAQMPPTPSAAPPRSAPGNRSHASHPSAPTPAAAAHGVNGPPKTPPPSKAANGNGHLSAAPPALWTPPKLPLNLEPDEDTKLAWLKGSLFCALWAEAITRQNFVTVCKPTPSDQKAAFEFFQSNPQAWPFYAAAVALNAWWASDRKKKDGHDKVYFCRRCLDIQSFLHIFATGKLESEIGQLGWKINPWKDLRGAFTESELTFHRWDKIPIVAIPPDELWENDSDAPDYYTARKLTPPPEVAAAQELRDQENLKSKTT